uniref:hypothetical protein n=1 Tax=Chitinophaga sp. GbtcB8 TaxID=2824753 RepID=UPI001C30BD2F
MNNFEKSVFELAVHSEIKDKILSIAKQANSDVLYNKKDIAFDLMEVVLNITELESGFLSVISE